MVIYDILYTKVDTLKKTRRLKIENFLSVQNGKREGDHCCLQF